MCSLTSVDSKSGGRGTEEIRRTKSGSFLDALRNYPLLADARKADSAGVGPMAVAAPLPLTFMDSSQCQIQGGWNTFSRFSQLPRADSPDRNNEPRFTLETLAAELAILSSSPTCGDLTYLTEDYYTTSTTISYSTYEGSSSHAKPPLSKSLSFPKVKRDASLKSCVHTEKVMRRAKSVRFADTQGLPLIEAIHQLSIGDSSYTENKIVPYDEEGDFHQVKLVSCKQSKELGSMSLNSEEKGKVAAAAAVAVAPNHTVLLVSPSAVLTPPPAKLSRQMSPPKRRLFRFNQPGSEPGFYERVGRDGVVLESVRDEPGMIRGVVRVANVAFHKEVTIRWTHDHWRTYHDTHAMYCANDGATDRFTFELPINGDQIEFAIWFRSNNCDYWDNNRGRNYVAQ